MVKLHFFSILLRLFFSCVIFDVPLPVPGQERAVATHNEAFQRNASLRDPDPYLLYIYMYNTIYIYTYKYPEVERKLHVQSNFGDVF